MSTYRHILRYWWLRLQHMNLGAGRRDTIQPITPSLIFTHFQNSSLLCDRPLFSYLLLSSGQDLKSRAGESDSLPPSPHQLLSSQPQGCGLCLLSSERFPWASHPCLSERKTFSFPCLSSYPFFDPSGQGLAIVSYLEETESDLL